MSGEKKQKIEFNRLFLLSGNDLKLNDFVSVKHPVLNDIFNLNNGFNCEEIYWSYIFILLSDPYDYMVELDDMGIDYEEVE